MRPEFRRAVIVALDDWAFCVSDAKVQERLRQIAGGADPDPMRQKFRKAKDRAALEAMAKMALTRKGDQPAAAFVLLSAALYKQGALETARTVLRRAVQMHPEDFWAHFQWAVMLGQENQGRAGPAEHEEQVGHCRAAVAARPQSALAHNLLGVALDAKGDREGAIAAFRQATALDPKFARAHYNLGLGLQLQGQFAEALTAFRRAAELFPSSNPDAKRAEQAARDCQKKVSGR
jgi:tetratricopeptide (TPR) repeat protein